MGREAPIIKNKTKYAVADFPVLGPITFLAHNIAIVRGAATTPFHAKRNAATRTAFTTLKKNESGLKINDNASRWTRRMTMKPSEALAMSTPMAPLAIA
jgi:hypothetical protein